MNECNTMTATKARKPATTNERKPTAAITPRRPAQRKLTRTELNQMLADAVRITAKMPRRTP